MDDVIDGLGVRKRIDAARVVEAWAHVAGLRINRLTSGAWVKRGTLYVKITSAAWRGELHLQRHAWRDRLNQHLGSDLVKDIVFR
jgi:predicted nucleic acid-binding Zn ribbon protein